MRFCLVLYMYSYIPNLIKHKTSKLKRLKHTCKLYNIKGTIMFRAPSLTTSSIMLQNYILSYYSSFWSNYVCHTQWPPRMGLTKRPPRWYSQSNRQHICRNRPNLDCMRISPQWTWCRCGRMKHCWVGGGGGEGDKNFVMPCAEGTCMSHTHTPPHTPTHTHPHTYVCTHCMWVCGTELSPI